MASMQKSTLINELRRLGNLDTVKRGVAGPPSYHASSAAVDEWKRGIVASFKAMNKARAQYRPRALAALADLREYAAGGGWHPSQGQLADWEERLAWASAEPFDVDAKLAEFVERFESGRSKALYG